MSISREIWQSLSRWSRGTDEERDQRCMHELSLDFNCRESVLQNTVD